MTIGNYKELKKRHKECERSIFHHTKVIELYNNYIQEYEKK